MVPCVLREGLGSRMVGNQRERQRAGRSEEREREREVYYLCIPQLTGSNLCSSQPSHRNPWEEATTTARNMDQAKGRGDTWIRTPTVSKAKGQGRYTKHVARVIRPSAYRRVPILAKGEELHARTPQQHLARVIPPSDSHRASSLEVVLSKQFRTSCEHACL